MIAWLEAVPVWCLFAVSLAALLAANAVVQWWRGRRRRAVEEEDRLPWLHLRLILTTGETVQIAGRMSKAQIISDLRMVIEGAEHGSPSIYSDPSIGLVIKGEYLAGAAFWDPVP